MSDTIEVAVEETRYGVMLNVEPPHPVGLLFEEVCITFDNLWFIRLYEGGLRVEHVAGGIQYEAEWTNDWDTIEADNAEVGSA